MAVVRVRLAAQSWGRAAWQRCVEGDEPLPPPAIQRTRTRRVLLLPCLRVRNPPRACPHPRQLLKIRRKLQAKAAVAQLKLEEKYRQELAEVQDSAKRRTEEAMGEAKAAHQQAMEGYRKEMLLQAGRGGAVWTARAGMELAGMEDAAWGVTSVRHGTAAHLRSAACACRSAAHRTDRSREWSQWS